MFKIGALLRFHNTGACGGRHEDFVQHEGVGRVNFAEEGELLHSVGWGVNVMVTIFGIWAQNGTFPKDINVTITFSA
jgi:hypothetical protein